jgi:hypothetical protein
VTLSELEPHERLAFAGLVRALVRQDGEVSPEEATAMTKLAHRVGAQQFWAAMKTAQECLPNPSDVTEAAQDVTRTEVREWAFGQLRILADADGFDVAEQALLQWLSRAWELE